MTASIEPQKHLADNWSVAVGSSQYDLSVYGPNGFFRGFKGAVSGTHRANLDVRAVYDENSNAITLEISNRASHVARASVLSAYTSRNTDVVLGPGESESKRWPLRRAYGWYDLIITVAGDTLFEYRFAGHAENGEDSISDPIMGGLL